MRVKNEALILFSMLIISDVIDLISCGNKRIKIYVPQQIKHVHHHHVKKVPVYIVTKEKPRVMHASHIEDDFDDFSYRKSPKTRNPQDYDDVLIQGIYKGDESHVHEDVNSNVEYTTLRPQVETKKQKLPYILNDSDDPKLQSYLQRNSRVRRNRLKLLYD